MASSSAFSMEKLIGRENFNTWKFAVQSYLEIEDLWDYVTEGGPDEKIDKKSPKKRAEHVPKKDPPILEAVGRLESLAQNIRQNEFDTFGQHVANQLRSVPLANAIACTLTTES
ncbi:hypothetical protein HUJ04_011191 [Dendroctonus ponderosae]|nr:hypothetical protein HUJ04_011191 [Dendroctonus ponderosae]